MKGARGQDFDPRTVVRVGPDGRRYSLAEAAAAASAKIVIDRRRGHETEPWIINLASYKIGAAKASGTKAPS